MTSEANLGSHGSTGGQRAIAGFLFQILRSVQLGIRVTAEISLIGTDLRSMGLTLEPVDSGDLQLRRNGRTTIEQVKFRSPRLRWASSSVAREVFPDLLRGSHPGTKQAFRFTTNNQKGLDRLIGFLERRRAGERRGIRSSDVNYSTRLAKWAGAAEDDPKFIWLLDNLEIDIVEVSEAENEIDRLLGPMLSPGQRADAKRHELTSRLLEAAREGRRLDARELLEMIGPDSLLRLQHTQTLPRHLRRLLAQECASLGYEVTRNVWRDLPPPRPWLTVLAGESGQGKTWALCQLALAQAEDGEATVLFRAPDSYDDLIAEFNERVWLPAFETTVPLQVIARRLRPSLARDHGAWLTLYLDDVQSRALAERIATTDWSALGVRVVVSAQPRIVEAIVRACPDTSVMPVRNFTSGELRRYLQMHARETPLETMPDDVFELLLKPIHARVFTRLPARAGWVGSTEYELFKEYWDFATGSARDQRDHPWDGRLVATLAGTLLGPRARYPWPIRDLQDVGLDEAAFLRLERVGLIRREANDQVVISSDRMLNWAVAEYLVMRIVDENISPQDAERELDQFDLAIGSKDTSVRRRLGYVPLDALWLLLSQMPAAFVADFIVAGCRRQPVVWGREGQWSDGLGTLGPRLVPVLERLALGSYYEEHDWRILHGLPAALVKLAEADRSTVADAISRLLEADSEQAVLAALKAAENVAVPRDVDRLWSIHVANEVAVEAIRRDPSRSGQLAELMHRRKLTSAALRTAASAAGTWLDDKISRSSDPFELDRLLWVLVDDDCIDEGEARDIWARHASRLLTILPNDSKGLIEALGHFGDVVNRARLDAVPASNEDWLTSRVLSSLARVDPAAAIRQIAERNEEHGWGTSSWWLLELAQFDPDGLAIAILENASRGDHPLTDVILFYRHSPELMRRSTLEWVLDRFAVDLGAFNDANVGGSQAELGRLGHPLRFLPGLIEPSQFDCLEARAGTVLETELVRFARARPGRSSRWYDADGAACERILAMIGGHGFSAAVVSELERADSFGREDGFSAAQWSEDTEVSSALSLTPGDSDRDGYRSVLQMQAFAIHCRDAEIEAMIRAQVPVYVNAAEMRSSGGRQTATLRNRVGALSVSDAPDDLYVAAQLACFLSTAAEAQPLVAGFLDPRTPRATLRKMVGTFRTLGLYGSELLPVVREFLVDSGDESMFAAAYLVESGGPEGRHTVLEWLGTLPIQGWSSSFDGIIQALWRHEDSREAIARFLRAAGGPFEHHAAYLRILAEAGDLRAQEELGRMAYREPSAFMTDTASAIAYMRSINPTEAQFAAIRLLSRHGDPKAIDLLLEIDIDSALGILLDRYRSAKPSLRWEIARRLRAFVDGERLSRWLTELSSSSRVGDRKIAIELAGWMAPSLDLAWLEAFLSDRSETLRKSAREAIRRRRRESAAMDHLAEMSRSSKALKWARLRTIVECVDPYFLWSRDDPASLREFLDNQPSEFSVEARQLLLKQQRDLRSEATKADRES